GNVYFVNGQAIQELPHALVDPTPRTEPALAGTDTLPVALPASINLTGPFLPKSDHPWLTITGVTNGVVRFAFTANSSLSRTAHISLLGQSVPVIQGGTGKSLGTSNSLEGSGAGSDSVVLAASSPWTASANASWLHLGTGYQSGVSSTNVIFSFD